MPILVALLIAADTSCLRSGQQHPNMGSCSTARCTFLQPTVEVLLAELAAPKNTYLDPDPAVP